MQDERIDRRGFFKTAFMEIARTMLEVSLSAKGRSERRRGFLRPPGAVDESLFNILCTVCNECIKVCPHMCVRGSDSAQIAKVGTPIIIPVEAPCRLCSDLPCIRVCKDGALKPVEDIKYIRMGTAVIDRKSCLNYTDGQNDRICQECYNHCPFKDEAIYLEEGGKPAIREGKCVGCGICENVCYNINSPSAVNIFV